MKANRPAEFSTTHIATYLDTSGQTPRLTSAAKGLHADDLFVAKRRSAAWTAARFMAKSSSGS
jgi:hypothetical protein